MKRGICLLLSLLLCLSLLSGCGKQDAGSSGSGGSSSAEGSASGEASQSAPDASGETEAGEDAVPRTLLGGSAAQTGDSAASAKGDSADAAALPTTLSVEGYTQEYGSAARSTSQNGGVQMNVTYPSGDCEVMNGLISNWLDQAGSLLPEGVDAGTLNMNYSSYTPNSRVVSVVLTGVLVSDHNTRPTPVIATFCADRITGAALVIEDMLAEGMYDTLVQRVAEAAGTELSGLPEHWVVTGSGFRFFLSDEGNGAFRAVDLSFDALSGVLTLPRPPMVAFTFDDGPSANTTRIVDLFSQYGAKCSFCVVGERLAEFADAAKYIVDQGFEIGIHTWDHTKLTNLSVQDITQEISSTQTAIQQYTSGSALFVRPPYGSADETVSAVCSDLGLYMAHWSIDTEDWKLKDAQAIADAILSQVKDGSIVLSHDLYDFTAEAMEIVVPQLVAQGYELVTLTEFINASYGEVVPGRMYFNSTEYRY